jgi:DNA-binding transcriptional LysR family regulator
VWLFDRSHDRVSLTAEGREFLAQARDILIRGDAACHAARQVARDPAGVVRFGATATSLLTPFVLRTLRAFCAEHLNVALSLQEMVSCRAL